MSHKIIYYLMLIVLAFTSCSKEDVDDVKPTIDTTFAEAYPQSCANLTRGSSFTFKVNFSDNEALGSYSIDVHHNFDHHSHATDVETCTLDAVKTPISPWTFIQNYTIPADQTTFSASGTISIPSNIDTGDYHFMYKVTDQSGWQTIKGFSIKIVD